MRTRKRSEKKRYYGDEIPAATEMPAKYIAHPLDTAYQLNARASIKFPRTL